MEQSTLLSVDLWSGREKKKRETGMARKRAENREGSLGFPGFVKPVFTKDKRDWVAFSAPFTQAEVVPQALLYVDDLQIICEGSDMRLIERQLQTAVNNLVKWCDISGHICLHALLLQTESSSRP
ncbi:hypothetical protein TNCV_2958711 [Trichonephila clavipes]|nr:hypothetical protein TNCV_2958711 [Trichonephila clavipes]